MFKIERETNFLYLFFARLSTCLQRFIGGILLQLILLHHILGLLFLPQLSCGGGVH
jgi:hypothetical protein